MIISALQQKRILRQKLRQKSQKIDEKQREEANKAIQEQLTNLSLFQQAQTVFCFISYAKEIHTHDLITQELLNKKQVAVPKIMSKTEMRAISITNWQGLSPDSYGILTPEASTETLHDFDLCITPGIAFTKQGHRMGYGRGYYDRWFSLHKVKHKVALAYEYQLLDNIPIEETDIGVDYIVTEKQVIQCANTN